MCDCEVSWNGWYHLIIQGQSVQMPDTCVDQDSCGTHAPLWLNGGHPRVEDGVVTRAVCGHYDNDCCSFQSNPIRVKACPGNYYVYEFVKPAFCFLAYCAGKYNIFSSHNFYVALILISFSLSLFIDVRHIINTNTITTGNVMLYNLFCFTI